MSLRWRELPIEIVRLVVAQAARSALTDNVSWLTQLSLVSRAFYDIVTPILYCTLVVTDYNITLVRVATSHVRLMAYVRKVCIAVRWNLSPWLWYEDPPSDENYFAGVDEVNIMNLLTYLPTTRKFSSSFRPRRLDMRDIPGLDVACFAHKGPSHLFPILTHLFLDCPSNLGAAHILMLGLHESLGRLPKLTHLALDLSHEILDSPSETTFANMLSAILETTDEQLEVLALRVSGEMLSQWDNVVRVVAGIQDRDRKLRVWRDDRAGDTTALRIQDARTGRDVWTEVKQL